MNGAFSFIVWRSSSNDGGGIYVTTYDLAKDKQCENQIRNIPEQSSGNIHNIETIFNISSDMVAIR